MKRNNVHVYIIEDAGRVKIGVSSNPCERIKVVCRQAGVVAGKRHHISAACSNGWSVERTLHKIFANKRIDGEWFAISFDDALRALSETPLMPPFENQDISGAELFHLLQETYRRI